MKKINNKGVTLVELIVSFALVSVAVIYFYQTVYTVKRLYSTARKETNRYVDVNYAYRMIDAKVEKYVQDNSSNYSNICNNTDNKISGYLGITDVVLDKYNITDCSLPNNNILKLTFIQDDGKCKTSANADEDDKCHSYNYVKYLPAILADPVPTITYSIAGDLNKSTGWYYNRTPKLTVTVSENNGAIIKRFKRCEDTNHDGNLDDATECEEKTLTNNKYVEDLQDTASGALKFKVTNYKDKQATKDVTYKVDTIPPGLAYKSFCIGSYTNEIGTGTTGSFSYYNVDLATGVANLTSDDTTWKNINNGCDAKSNFTSFSSDEKCQYVVKLNNNQITFNFAKDLTRALQQDYLYGQTGTWQKYIYGYNQALIPLIYDYLSGVGVRKFTYINEGVEAGTFSSNISGKTYSDTLLKAKAGASHGFKVLELCDKAGNCSTGIYNKTYTDSISCSKNYAKQASDNFYNCLKNGGSDVNIDSITHDLHAKCSAKYSECSGNDCDSKYNAKFAACMIKCYSPGTTTYESCAQTTCSIYNTGYNNISDSQIEW